MAHPTAAGVRILTGSKALKVGRFAAKPRKAPASERARRLREGKKPWRDKTP